MAQATGKVIDTPSQQMPFKAVVSTDGETLRERFFISRERAEAYIVDALKGLRRTAAKGAADAGRR